MNVFRKLMHAIDTVADAFNGLASAIREVTAQIESRYEGLEEHGPETIDVSPVTNGKGRRKRIGRRS